MEFKKIYAWNEEHQSILDNITSLADMSNEGQVQKKKITLLSELLLKLCTSRNVRSNYKDLTSLILLFLNMYKKNYPIDIYSADTKESQLKPQCNLTIKRILQQELISSKPIQ